MPQVQIVIQVYGGVVQGVYCSAPEATVIVVDFDVASDFNTAEPGLVTFETRHRRKLAFVAQALSSPLEALAGTEVEQAIEAAACAEA